MTRISNYKELVAERIRLQQDLQNQKANLKAEMNSIKARLEPLGDLISFLGFFKKRDVGKTSLLQTGLSMGIDLLVRDNLLSKSSWIARTLLPVVLKGVSNQFLKKKISSDKVLQ